MPHSWFTQTEVYLLHEIVTRLDRLARLRVLDANGLTYAEFLVAMAVSELGEPAQGEVGELLDMSKSLVSQRVTSLIAKNFVIQNRDAENRRQVRLALTPTGRQALERVYEKLAGNAESILDSLGSSRAEFLQSLRRLRDAVAAAEGSYAEARDAVTRFAGLVAGRRPRQKSRPQRGRLQWAALLRGVQRHVQLSTFTRGSPKTPARRPLMWLCTSARTASSLRPRALATVGTCISAFVGEISGSSPDADVVTASAGIGPLQPASCFAFHVRGYAVDQLLRGRAEI